MMSQSRLLVGAVARVDTEALAEELGLTQVPRATWLIPELLEPAWNAITPPISRPSTTATASWTAIRPTPPPRLPFCSRGHYVRSVRRHDTGQLEDLHICSAQRRRSLSSRRSYCGILT